MGDSITKGAMSEYAEGQVPNRSSQDTWEKLVASKSPRFDYVAEECWVTKLAKMKNWVVTNEGVGNTGWMTNSPDNTLTADPSKDPSGFTPIDNAWKIAEKVANETVDGVKGFKRFDVVTLMYGVNDWAYNRYLLGDVNDAFNYSSPPTTLVAGMRKTLETIIESNPYCKIFVITPLNRRGAYNTTAQLYVDESTNWAYGFEKSQAKSLEHICEQIKKVCYYYGVEVIDMGHESIINRRNLPIMLPDNTHPTAEAHTIMARELCDKINYSAN
jgi:lysophospholipase L1-like esterase